MFFLTEPAPAGTCFATTGFVSTRGPADDSVPAEIAGPTTVHSTLSPSLREDLLRFADRAETIELLPALAACVRHARPVALRLDLAGLAVAATIHPREQLFRAPIDLGALSPGECRALRLVGVEPQDEAPLHRSGAHDASGPLRPLLWRLALHGARGDLLPEVQGRVRYRMAYGAALKGLALAPEFEPLLARLRTVPLGLDELAAGCGLPRAVVQRLINALYLQSGLMVVRAFGAA